jgi:VWFA-related protein
MSALRRGLFLTAVTLPLWPQSPAVETTIRVPVRLVTVPTLVFSNEKRLVPGLEAGDFTVFDNSQRQRVTLDASSVLVSVAVAVQTNLDVREYLPIIAKAGSVIETLLAGENGEAAAVAYGDDVTVIKPFESGDLQIALRSLSAVGRKARMIDAGMRALKLLEQRPGMRSRVLLLIGQPMDSGSESTLTALRAEAERENVTVFALLLPEIGKAFVSDTFALEGLSSRTDRGGFKASVDLGKLIPVLNRTTKAAKSTDPFSLLTAATGGTQLHFRRQWEFEDAIAAVGLQLRSAYLLSYTPTSPEIGYHTIKVEVDVPRARTYARPGYWRARD